MKYGTRATLRQYSEADAGGGAVTRTWTDVCTVYLDVQEIDQVTADQAVPIVVTLYSLRLRKPVHKLDGTKVTLSAEMQFVTLDETPARTFQVITVRGAGERDREYVITARTKPE